MSKSPCLGVTIKILEYSKQNLINKTGSTCVKSFLHCYWSGGRSKKYAWIRIFLLEVLNNNILSTYFLSHPKKSYKNYDSFLHFSQKFIQKRRLCPPFKYIEKIAGLGRGFGLEKKNCSVSCGIAAGGDFPPQQNTNPRKCIDFKGESDDFCREEKWRFTMVPSKNSP